MSNTGLFAVFLKRYSIFRYNPNDMKVLDARRKLGEFGNADKAERIAAYQDVITKVKPVMRHFFTEKHYLPSKWFEMRLMYSRSTAVMSMVGFVLGLGDRHVSNIMIDTLLGELVPIDLGIAFEAVSIIHTSRRLILLVSVRVVHCLLRSSSHFA